MDQKTDDILIKVEGVSKKFCRSLKRSLWYGIKDISSEMIGKKRSEELRSEEFWALKDVSFELKRGECLGLIGHNGAGKSTLLKMLNGLIKPDQGRIEMNGKVGALIELGAGFNPILTGRENVYNNAAVLGFSKEEIDAKYQDIVTFAELEEFMETPVRSYSSGMKVRLGFAVAAQMEPDVLIIDEVLAVGDIGFQVKCFNKINELIKSSAVIFVSHSMPNIGRISSRVILLRKGHVEVDSISSHEAIEAYYSGFKTERALVISSLLSFNGIEFLGPSGKELRFGDDLCFNFQFTSKDSITGAHIGLSIMDQSLRIVGAYRNYIGKIEKGINTVTFLFEKLQFSGNQYYFSIEINSVRNGLKQKVFGLFKNIENFSICDHPFEVDSVVYLNGSVKLND